MTKYAYVIALAAMVVSAACGGGSGSPTTPPTSPPETLPTPPTSFDRRFSDMAPKSGATEVVVVQSNGTVEANMEWAPAWNADSSTGGLGKIAVYKREDATAGCWTVQGECYIYKLGDGDLLSSTTRKMVFPVKVGEKYAVYFWNDGTVTISGRMWGRQVGQ